MSINAPLFKRPSLKRAFIKIYRKRQFQIWYGLKTYNVFSLQSNSIKIVKTYVKVIHCTWEIFGTILSSLILRQLQGTVLFTSSFSSTSANLIISLKTVLSMFLSYFLIWNKCAPPHLERPPSLQPKKFYGVYAKHYGIYFSSGETNKILYQEEPQKFVCPKINSLNLKTVVTHNYLPSSWSCTLLVVNKHVASSYQAYRTEPRVDENIQAYNYNLQCQISVDFSMFVSFASTIIRIAILWLLGSISFESVNPSWWRSLLVTGLSLGLTLINKNF